MRGRAATAFWNVDGLVKFASAQDGAVLYFDEFAFDEERRGLPDEELVPLVDLVAVDLEDEEDHDDTGRPSPTPSPWPWSRRSPVQGSRRTTRRKRYIRGTSSDL